MWDKSAGTLTEPGRWGTSFTLLQSVRRLTANVTGGTTLLLAAVGGGDGIDSDYADWATTRR